jgi:hypothetical protein
MHKTIQLFQTVFMSGLLLMFPAPKAHAATYQINVSGNRLSADFQNMPLSTVINDIGAKTGIRFTFLGGAAAAAGYSAPFSIRIASLPVRKALEKLLSNFNYSVISDGNDNIQQVFILGAKSASKTSPATQPPFSVAARPAQTVRQEPAVNPAGPGGMQIEPGEGMQVTPGEGMTVSPGEGMQITPGEGMQIAPGGGGSTPDGMQIGPASPEGMNAAPESTEGVAAQSPGAREDLRTPVRRSNRFGGVRKK